ncbi:MAG: hypothetical protein C0605_10510 [Hyphomicrobiales bacterium]|nr:MAG: hypothetical protein C0605_10510 [Hyphomicrobiales bacterium]
MLTSPLSSNPEYSKFCPTATRGFCGDKYIKIYPREHSKAASVHQHTACVNSSENPSIYQFAIFSLLCSLDATDHLVESLSNKVF